MKKRILGVLAITGVIALASCNNEQKVDSTDRKAYVEVLNKCSEKLQEKSETNLQSSVSMDYFELEGTSNNNYYEATGAYVYFLNLLYQNENYKVTEDAVKIDCDYVKDSNVIQDNTMSILGKLDKEKGIVNFELYGTSVMASGNGTSTDSFFYLVLDIQYDFSESVLKDFDLYFTEVNKDAELDSNTISAFRYFEGKKYTGITTEENRKVFLDFINDNYWSLHKESILSAEYIGDFSYEYVKTTDDIFGPDFFNVY